MKPAKSCKRFTTIASVPKRGNQSQLAHDLLIAREALKKGGAVSFDTNTVAWNAVNQITGEAKSIQLPRWRIGGIWLGQNTSADKPSPIVDEVRH